jgi:hypothetical protein
MKTGTIHLFDVDLELFVEWDRQNHNKTFGRDLITKAYETLCAKYLRYNIATGITRCNDGERARYSNASDIPTEYTFEDAAYWQFSPFVRNAASRMSRGFTAD